MQKYTYTTSNSSHCLLLAVLALFWWRPDQCCSKISLLSYL